MKENAKFKSKTTVLRIHRGVNSFMVNAQKQHELGPGGQGQLHHLSSRITLVKAIPYSSHLHSGEED